MASRNSSIYSLLAAILVFIGFFFSFISVSALGYSVSVASGFTFAFSFAAFPAVLCFLVFLANLAMIVLLAMNKKGPWGIVFYVCALLMLIAIITIGSVSEYGVSGGSGFGIWWCLIFLIIAGTLYMFGDKFKLPELPMAKVRDGAQKMAESAQKVAHSASVDAANATAPAKYCGECGAKMASDAKFCPNCGKKCE